MPDLDVNHETAPPLTVVSLSSRALSCVEMANRILNNHAHFARICDCRSHLGWATRGGGSTPRRVCIEEIDRSFLIFNLFWRDACESVLFCRSKAALMTSRRADTRAGGAGAYAGARPCRTCSYSKTPVGARAWTEKWGLNKRTQHDPTHSLHPATSGQVLLCKSEYVALGGRAPILTDFPPQESALRGTTSPLYTRRTRHGCAYYAPDNQLNVRMWRAHMCSHAHVRVTSS